MMRHVFSIRTLLDATVQSVEGQAIARVHDVVWNHTQRKVTHLLLTPLDAKDSAPPTIFALHQSFFFAAEEENTLAYSPKIGKDESAYFIQLPPQYHEMEAGDVTAFNQYLRTYTATAGHRSDNE